MGSAESTFALYTFFLPSTPRPQTQTTFTPAPRKPANRWKKTAKERVFWKDISRWLKKDAFKKRSFHRRADILHARL